ncbi:hypothetical protein DM01DRAFT_1333388 [Hesseltinella vesiculosa]|uniref:SAC domain-containing protein n=1 Tax=Hesseltinella vesiculosa TaxID=101127 RepID=A0A1X2GPU5_9FUNG|nr:hypothetical protein DM01DRAFT_1333388 [Hesseltinella vesiculosa]
MNQDAHLFQEFQQLQEGQLVANEQEILGLNCEIERPRPPPTPSVASTTIEEKVHIPRTGNYSVMSHYELYETKTRFYLVGSDYAKQRFKVLQIHRTNPNDLVVIEDDVVYSQQEKTKLLGMIEDGNLSVGGLHPVTKRICGIVGFVRFTLGWYMVVITKCKQVALLGGHYIYHIEATELIPIGYQAKVDKNNNTDEGRYITTFENIELTKNFYFSYTYDLTNTLQVNMTCMPGFDTAPDSQPRESSNMFIWNDYLLKTGFKNVNARSGWILHLTYGFVDQAKISVFGRNIIITLIARRSRHFAGARFLKRGANDKGFVANDVETEQIVAELSTTSFHSHDQLYNNPRYSSYVQHRGSIPLFWSQDITNMSPKPPIELTVVDPFYSAAALHFEDLFRRYGTPVTVLNLIKQKEKAERESILGKEFADTINYLNQFLPEEKKIKYIAWDMSRASKSHDQDVIGYLENIAEETIASTGFFYTGSTNRQIPPSRQHGVLRTNCIDCLDRTNAAQFLMGKCALGHQLYALGVISSPYMQFDSDAINVFTEMYHDHGDTIALQYGGSHLVNTMETYRKINQWTSHPRDAIESLRRYYANAFSDGEKQDAINLFLGNFVTKDGQPMLWELNSDYHLHNQDPRIKAPRRDYRHWCSQDALCAHDNGIENNGPPERFVIPEECRAPASNPEEGEEFQGYWEEYYRHREYTNLKTLLAFNMNGTLKSQMHKMYMFPRDAKRELTPQEAKELSPFTSRTATTGGQRTHPDQHASKQVADDQVSDRHSFKEKSGRTLEKMVDGCLNPTVNPTEMKEYKRYTQQYRNVDKFTATHSDSYANIDNFPEYQQYLSYIHRNHLEDHPSAIKTQAIDEEMFHTYVSMPSRAAVGDLGHRSWSKRYDVYASYVQQSS